LILQENGTSRSTISDDEGTILTALGISDENWLEIIQHFEGYLLGAVEVEHLGVLASFKIIV
jgi:hypothetical protein